VRERTEEEEGKVEKKRRDGRRGRKVGSGGNRHPRKRKRADSPRAGWQRRQAVGRCGELQFGGR
jgi:hypothetical protein